MLRMDKQDFGGCVMAVGELVLNAEGTESVC